MLKQSFLIKNKIGEGKNAEVYNVCYETNCNLVLKKLSLTRTQGKIPITIEQFQKEIRNQQEAAIHGIAPKIVFSYITDDKTEGGIIMEKLDKTLLDYLLNPRNSVKSKKYLLENAILTLKKLHKIGIAHGDVKLENFMLNDEDDVFLIDFGYSNSIVDTSKIQSKFKEDMLEIFDYFKSGNFGFPKSLEFLQKII